MRTIVLIDSERASAMLAELASRTLYTDEVNAAADEGARLVTGVVDSPPSPNERVDPDQRQDLAASIHGTPGRDSSPNSALIVSDLNRARFLFAAHPPSFPGGDVARILAAKVSATLFGGL